jgi:hypothetical protein
VKIDMSDNNNYSVEKTELKKFSTVLKPTALIFTPSKGINNKNKPITSDKPQEQLDETQEPNSINSSFGANLNENALPFISKKNINSSTDKARYFPTDGPSEHNETQEPNSINSSFGANLNGNAQSFTPKRNSSKIFDLNNDNEEIETNEENKNYKKEENSPNNYFTRSPNLSQNPNIRTTNSQSPLINMSYDPKMNHFCFLFYRDLCEQSHQDAGEYDEKVRYYSKVIMEFPTEYHFFNEEFKKELNHTNQRWNNVEFRPVIHDTYYESKPVVIEVYLFFKF